VRRRDRPRRFAERALVTIALHGNLRDFGMGEVFQLIGQQRKTGVLEVRGAQGEVELRFDAGGVVAAMPVADRREAPLVDMIARCGLVPRDRLAELEHATDPDAALVPRILEAGLLEADALREVEDLLTRETIFDLLRWEDGSFRFVAQAIEHDRAAEQLLGAEQVLMDGLRMVDEWQAFASDRPDDATVYRRRGSVEEYRQSLAGRSDGAPLAAERIFLLIDGRANVRRVIDLSRLGSFEGMRAFVLLARSGWIEALRARRTPATDAAPVLRGSERRIQLATVVPFALLALLALAPWLRGTASRDPLALPAVDLDVARVRAETAQWRALAHAHELATGRAEIDPARLAAWAGDAAPALTRSEAGVYHVAARAEGPVLLAPDDREPAP
jgi:hypothetical protein